MYVLFEKVKVYIYIYKEARGKIFIAGVIEDLFYGTFYIQRRRYHWGVQAFKFMTANECSSGVCNVSHQMWRTQIITIP